MNRAPGLDSSSGKLLVTLSQKSLSSILYSSSSLDQKGKRWQKQTAQTIKYVVSCEEMLNLADERNRKSRTGCTGLRAFRSELPTMPPSWQTS